MPASRKCIVSVGDRFGRLEVTTNPELRQHYNQRASFVDCRCDCGNTITVKAASLTSSVTKSCGCLRNEKASQRAAKLCVKHNKSGSRLFRIWCGMKARCYIKSVKQFKDYGGRGITVCDEWRSDFLTFEKWSLEHGYQDTLTIDRVDTNGNYTPENCRWATRAQQAANKRTTLDITAWGETKKLREWSRDCRCRATEDTIRYRIKVGWTPENAIATPTLRHFKCGGESMAETAQNNPNFC